MRNLGIAFLALVALFMGGCSLLFIGVQTYECSITNRMCHFSGPLYIIAVPIFIVAWLIGRWAWRIYMGPPKSPAIPSAEPEVQQPSGQRKSEFGYRGRRVRVMNNFYCYDRRNFETKKAVKEYIDLVCLTSAPA